MYYVSSDLHGCHPQAFIRLLDRAGFCEDDELYILGDVIDRGEFGAEMLLWITQQPNVRLILGNHEALMRSCSFLFDEVTDESLAKLTPESLALVQNWIDNGGQPTIRGLKRLMLKDPSLVRGIFDYLREEATLYDELILDGKRFILVHAGLGNFSPDKALSDYSAEELLMIRPAPDERYFDDATVIFGHTPTAYYGTEHNGRAFHGPGWVCIDTGAAMGGKPMLLRLEDMAEIYLPQHKK